MKKNWQPKETFPSDFKEKNKDYSDLVLQMLWNRGIKNEKEIENFLNPSKKDLIDPFVFGDMEKVVAKIITHIKSQNKITVYGDYDADGVTSSALMVEVLRTLQARVDIRIPNRVTEGYGLNDQAIKEIADNNTKLLITVDNGIRNYKEIETAKNLGLDVIITDHHMPPEDNNIPNCLIINPNLKSEKYPNKSLSGVGVAFKVTGALISKSKLEEDEKKKLNNKVSDLLAIGTVTDCVSLLGENRNLVRYGLERLNKTKRKGLKELIAVAGIANKKLDAWNIGFQIGPRLNAAGRMGSANTAYELLTTDSNSEARSLGKKLNERNIKRQIETEEILNKVEKQINSKDKILIGVYKKEEAGEPWNEGIIGLVSSRITTKYYRPSLVITKSEDGYKGSGRGIAEINMIDLIEKTKEHLSKYGGHPGACGFSLEEEKLNDFVNAVKVYAEKKLDGLDLKPRIEIESIINLEELNNELTNEILNFSPFGTDNPRPVFISQELTVLDIITMGIDKQHIKFRVKENNSNVFSALGFSQAEKWKDIKIGDKISLVFNIELNEFNSKIETQLRIIDISTLN